jgi:thiol-disulfide isomerase/thioredoxin
VRPAEVNATASGVDRGRILSKGWIMRVRRLAGSLLLALALGACGRSDLYARSLEGDVPPALDTASTTWLNTEAPLTLSALRGKVVYLEFTFQSCPACRVMAPHLSRWHKEMADKGLVVLTVEDGRATPLDALRQALDREEVRYPVLHDGVAANVALYEVRGFPSAYVIGRTGKVIWEGPPLAKLSELEKTIRKAVGA